MYKIFDIHTHTYPEKIATKATENLGRFYNFHVDRTGTISDLMSNCRDNGISGFLLLGVATNAHQVRNVNEGIAHDMAEGKRAGFEVRGFAAMHQDMEEFASELDYAVSLGLCGVKLHPDIQGADIDDERWYPLYALLEAKGLPLYLHMGDDRPQYRFSEPRKLVKILDNFPKLTVIAAHFGGYRSWDEAVRYLKRRENVWFDTSSALWAMTPEFARYLIDELGYERIMFGTDYPVVSADDELKRFFAVSMTEDERRCILYDNAARLLKLPQLKDSKF